jgi:nicotinate dehydrogenase subunit B
MQAYLRHGIADEHAMSAGPMVEVTHGLSEVSDEALRAIAVYTVSLDRRNDDERRRAREAALERARSVVSIRGNPIYDGACADCHNRGRAQEGGALELPLGTALTIPTPRNLAYIIRDGIVPREGERGGWMPGYAGALTDEQMTELLTYLRALSGQPAWPDVAADVRKISRGQ